MQKLYRGKLKIMMHILTHSVLFSVLCALMLTFFSSASDQQHLKLADREAEGAPVYSQQTFTEEVEEEFVPETQPVPNSTVVPATPQFVVRLPDKNLLCFSIDGYELFTYNLITSSYLVMNGFLNLTSIRPHKDKYNQTRGFNDIGVIVKAVDKRIKVGRRYFKHLVYGGKKKAIMEGFGEVDLNKGAITFSLMNGHSNIESQQSPHEKFRVILDKPRTDILAVASNGNTFNVYVEDCLGLVKVDMHGIIGQFFHPKVRIRDNYQELHLANGRVVPVEKGVVWEAVVDEGYRGGTCWYPREGETVIEGSPLDYIVEHIMSTNYKYSLFSHN